jgi:hypothetical protein
MRVESESVIETVDDGNVESRQRMVSQRRSTLTTRRPCARYVLNTYSISARTLITVSLCTRALALNQRMRLDHYTQCACMRVE